MKSALPRSAHGNAATPKPGRNCDRRSGFRPGAARRARALRRRVASVSSRCENPPRPRSNTPWTRQSVPCCRFADAGAVSEAQRAAGPAQLRAGQFRRKQPFHQAARKSVAWSSRYLTPGLLSSAIPCMDAQAAVWRNESPPGPRASAIRNRAAPSTTSRRRWMALVSIARSSRSRSAGSRSNTSVNRSVKNRCCVLHLPPRIRPLRAGSSTILAPMGEAPW